MPAITPAIQTARPELRLQTPEVAAVQLVTGVATKPVIILINLVVIHLLLIGVLITEHVTVTVVLTELGNLVTLAAAVQAALQAALTPEGEVLVAAIVLRVVLVHLIPVDTDKTELYSPVRPDTGYAPRFPLAPV